MRVLVFGQSGQVATELAKHADDITCLSRNKADLSDPVACAKIVATAETDIIINAAAYTAVDKAEEDEALATVVNGSTVAAMAEAAAKRDIPFLHISTDYVFEGSGATPWKPTDPTSPINAYGRSKLVGEHGVVAAGGPYAVLRTSWVISGHGNNFVKTMLRLGVDREILSIVGDQIGGPTSAADIAAALLKIATAFYQGQGVSGIYHYAGSPEVSWAEFAVEIFRQAGLNVDVKGITSEQYPTPAKRPENSRMDCSDIQAVFGIECPDWRASVNAILKELKAV